MKKTVKYTLNEEQYQLIKDIIDDLQDEIDNHSLTGAHVVLGALKQELLIEEE